MKLKLVRDEVTESYTFGSLYVDGVKFCETLEDTDRYLEVHGEAAKIAKETAIPRGVYLVAIDWSERFKREMLHVLDVPCFEGIRIHAGNTVADTSGCVLVGGARGRGYLLNSRATLDKLYALVDHAIDGGQTIELEVA